MGNSTGYGYVNARIRGMRSFFLPQSIYETILSLKSINEFIEVLRSTSYKNILESELLIKTEVEAINRAVGTYFVTQFTKIVKFTKGESHQLFQLLIWRIEVENVKLLSYRIINTNKAPNKLKTILIPINGSSYTDIDLISSIDSLETLQNWLATKQSPLVEALRILRKQPDEFLTEIVESIFDRFYFNHVTTTLNSMQNTISVRVFREMISEEIHFNNIRMALRLLIQASRDRFSPNVNIPELFIPNEKDSYIPRLIHAFQTGNMDKAYAICRRSKYGKFLPLHFSKTAFRSQMEINDLIMEVQFIRNQIRNTKKNSQGIGLGLAFYWQIMSENRNLRFLSYVIDSNFSRDDARRLLVLV